MEHAISPEYLGWLTDSNVYRYIGRDEYFQRIDQNELIKYAKEMWAEPFVSFFAVCTQEDNKFIGTAKINFVNEKLYRNGIADLGVMIGNRCYWGRGISIEIIRLLSNFAFFHMNVRKLTAGVHSLNEPMIKAFLRVGFKQDGCLRQQLSVEGNYCDHILLSCFANELL